ncbi:MAG: GntR family transcriptional regulator [Firmicutes bacterium]|nr:GntR family transcriptional regulator [Bacillota bacterium]
MSIQVVDRNNPLPRYVQAMLIIQQRIRSGKYRPGERIPGERDLAVELRVSQMTMNRALMELAKEGWIRREHGKGTFVPENFCPPPPEVLQIGVVAHIPAEHALEDFYLGSLFRGMQRAIVNTSVSLSILEVPADEIEKIGEALLDGLLVLDMLEQNVEKVNQLYRAGLKMVVLGASWEGLEVPFVDSDNVAGTRAALEHLISLGHRRIGGVFALPRTCNTQDRLRTFQQTLQERGTPPDDTFVLMEEEATSISQPGREKIRQILRSSARPTAFFCGGYYLALEVMRIAREEGLDIPEDLSVVGFDDPVSAALLSPPLTTVRQPLDEMGRVATEMLLEWLKNTAPPRHGVVLPAQLMVRQSTTSPGGNT